MFRIKGSIAIGAAVTLWCASSAAGVTLGFEHISAQGGDAANSAFASGVGAQLFVDVADEGGGQVRFTFRNTGPLQSVIEAVYFDDGTLLGIASVVNTPGETSFTQDGPGPDKATPPDLPGGDSMDDPFVVTASFLADADPAPSDNGVGPDQEVAIIFDLKSGKSFNDVLDDLNDGSLRIGMHVISMPDGESDAFVNNGVVIPLPAPAALGMAGLAPLALLRRRR